MLFATTGFVPESVHVADAKNPLVKVAVPETRIGCENEHVFDARKPFVKVAVPLINTGCENTAVPDTAMPA